MKLKYFNIAYAKLDILVIIVLVYLFSCFNRNDKLITSAGSAYKYEGSLLWVLKELIPESKVWTR